MEELAKDGEEFDVGVRTPLEAPCHVSFPCSATSALSCRFPPSPIFHTIATPVVVFRVECATLV